MGTGKTHTLPARLEAVRRRFQQWRKTRKAGSRIPERLWAAAVKQAAAYGIHPTAKALGLDYYSLKKRLEEQSRSGCGEASPNSGPLFVELAATTSCGIRECLVELESVDGVTMRIQAKGIEAGDLTALSRSLWEVA